MQQSGRQNGIISYAGLSKNALYALAKQAFAQADFDIPERFSAFLPLFPFELVQNMDYVGPKFQANARVAASGFSIDPVEYHRKLSAQMPQLYEGDNYRRNYDYEGRYQGRGAFTVDKTWAALFPQYQPFLGEKLAVYLLGGGHQAVAVPESLYPRGMGILAAIERRMQITQSAQQFVEYARGRVEAGEEYQADAFGADYLARTGFEAVLITQSELGRILQDISIAKSLQQENPSAGLFTESAKRVENLRQYMPFHYACDTFESAPVTRHTARLCQPRFEGLDFISDLWIPYQDVGGYIDKQRMALNMASLCEGYQIAPVYDPRTGGGLYPNSLLVVIVRDREIPVMTSDVLNNPAFGSGMSPQGMIGRQVFIHDSRELLRQRKLMPEDIGLTAENTALTQKAYGRALALASLQETKGQLIDAMYRREAALSQMVEGSQPYEKAKRLLDGKVEALDKGLQALSAAWGHNQMSGYDADISYLRRKGQRREDMPEGEREPIAFAPDTLREQSIEAGYAMRNGWMRVQYAQVRVEPTDEQLRWNMPDMAMAAPTVEQTPPPEQDPIEETPPKALEQPEAAIEQPKAAGEVVEENPPPEQDPIEQTPPKALEQPEAAIEQPKAAGEVVEENPPPEQDPIEETPPKAIKQPKAAIEQPKAAGEVVEENPPPEQDPIEETPPKAIKQPKAAKAAKAARQRYTFEDIAPRAQTVGEAAAPKLAEAVRRGGEPVKPVNKSGKMAALAKKKHNP